jgi:hypothetical protein
VNTSGIGELPLRQAGQRSGSAKVTTVMTAIDLGSGHVVLWMNFRTIASLSS